METAIAVSDGDRRQRILKRVVAIVADEMGVDATTISESTRFVEDLNADSLDQVELIMEFENSFSLSISEQDAQKLHSVADVVTYLVDHTDIEK